jgi:hypothetical protein
MLESVLNMFSTHLPSILPFVIASIHASRASVTCFVQCLHRAGPRAKRPCVLLLRL